MTTDHSTSSISISQYLTESLDDRVRHSTPVAMNAKIDHQIVEQLKTAVIQSDAAIAERLQQLEQEWDTERILETNASLLAFTGLLLGLLVHPGWFWLTGIVLPFLLQHAIQGWCPPLLLIRRLGARTRKEIDLEKYALKAIRGDFNSISKTTEADATTRAWVAMQSVQA